MKSRPSRRFPTVGLAFVFALIFALLAPPLGSVRADEVTHEIQKAPTRATLGSPGKAPITVQGKNGWHVNEAAPITVTVKAAPDVQLPKPKMARPDLAQSTKESARFEIPFTAASAGRKTITAEARFVMCQAQACKPVKETVALEIDVASPTVAPVGKGALKKLTKATTATP